MFKMLSNFYANNQKLLLFLVVVLFSLLKLINLDQDAPPLKLAGITQEDEPYYCFSGLHKYNIEEGKYIDEFVENKNELLSFHSKYLSYWSFKLFGNNFFGLRIPMVIFSMITLWILILTLFSLKDRFNFTDSSNYSIFFIVIWLLVEFNFYTFSRYHNPQLYSILAITVCLYWISKTNVNSYIYYFGIGFLVNITFTLIYIFNVYFFLAVGFSVLIHTLVSKKYKYLGAYILGNLFALLFITTLSVFLNSSLTDTIEVITNYKSTQHVNLKVVNYLSFKDIFYQIFQRYFMVMGTNFFRYNMWLLFLVLLIIPYFIYQSIKQKNLILSILVFSILFALLQNQYIAHFSFKKMITLLPFVVLMLYVFMNNSSSIFSFYSKKRFIYYMVFLGAFLTCILSGFLINKTLFFEWNNQQLLKYSYLLYFLNIIILFIVIFVYYKVKNNKYAYILFFIITPHIIINANYIWLHPTYNYKNHLINLSTKTNGKVAVGGYSHSAQFYNNFIPAYTFFDWNNTAKIQKQIFRDSLTACCEPIFIDIYAGFEKYQNYSDVIYSYNNDLYKCTVLSNFAIDDENSMAVLEAKSKYLGNE